MHKVLIVGGTGYIGSTLIELLKHEPNFECYTLVRRTSKYFAALKELCAGTGVIVPCKTDKITKNDISEALCKYKITVIIDLVATKYYQQINDKSDWNKCIDENKYYLNNLITASYEYNPNILVITTSGNFSLIQKDTKNTTISPSSSNIIPFNKYKKPIIDEWALMLTSQVHNDYFIKKEFIDNGYNVCIVYPCSLYGASPINRNGIWFNIFYELINITNINDLNDFKIKDLYTLWCDVRDCAEMYIQIIKYGKRNNYYLIGNEKFSVSHVALKLAQNECLKFNEKNKQFFIDNCKIPKDEQNIKWNTKTTNDLLHFSPRYSLNDEQTLKQWIKALNYYSRKLYPHSKL